MSDPYFVPAGVRDQDDPTRPLYGASARQAVDRLFRNYFVASGRASQSEYWWPLAVTLAVIIVAEVPIQVGNALDGAVEVLPTVLRAIGVTAILVWLFVAGIGYIGLTIRRLHDANASGWWFLLNFVPCISVIFTIAAGLLPSKPEGARFDVHSRPGPIA